MRKLGRFCRIRLRLRRTTYLGVGGCSYAGILVKIKILLLAHDDQMTAVFRYVMILEMFMQTTTKIMIFTLA